MRARIYVVGAHKCKIEGIGRHVSQRNGRDFQRVLLQLPEVQDENLNAIFFESTYHWSLELTIQMCKKVVRKNSKETIGGWGETFFVSSHYILNCLRTKKCMYGLITKTMLVIIRCR